MRKTGYFYYLKDSSPWGNLSVGFCDTMDLRSKYEFHVRVVFIVNFKSCDGER